jgi:electron transport complex protein RnfG
MAKKSTLGNMLLMLVLVSLVASAALAGVFILTEKPIKEAKQKELEEMINIVVPGADKAKIESFSHISLDEKNADTLSFYIVKIDDKVIGTAVKSFTNNGFSGRIDVMVGFDADGNIIDSDVLEHKETPGLGDKSTKKKGPWNKQFMGKNPQADNFKVKKDMGEIDAITAATITSRAYVDAIKRASDAYEKYYKGKEETNNE